MATTQEFYEQMEKIDLQILELLKDRSKLCRDLQESEEGALPLTSDVVALWIEEAGERGLDEDIVEKMAKLIHLLCKTEEE